MPSERSERLATVARELERLVREAADCDAGFLAFLIRNAQHEAENQSREAGAP